MEQKIKINQRFIKARPITQEEFDNLLKVILVKYRGACLDVYLYGKRLKEVCEKYQIGRRAFQKQLRKGGYCYNNLRYGHMGLLLSKGYTIESVRESLGLSTKRNDLNKMMQEKIRGDVSPSKRWRILRRDKFRCVICGSDATDRKLHIDHIKPVAEGGKSTIDNLRVLCCKCNLGRVSKSQSS